MNEVISRLKASVRNWTGHLASSLHGRPSLFALIALAVVLLSPFVPTLIHGSGKIFGDVLGDNPKFFYFTSHFAGQSWRDGEVPLWNPYIMLGMPFLGEGQGAVFHPLSGLFLLLPTGMAMNLLIALCFVLTGLGFWGYLRSLELSRRASFCGAVTWCFSSAMIGRLYAGHVSMLLGFPSLPALLMFWERYRRNGGVHHLAGVSLVYACLIFAGHPMSTYVCSLFVLVYVLIQSAADCGSFEQALRAMRSALALALAVLVGVGIGAVQIVPSLDFARESYRGVHSLALCATFSFAPENFLTLLCPEFYGTSKAAGPDQYWGRNYLWEMWIHIGILPLLAAVTGFMTALRKRRILLITCAIIFLPVALGKHTPLFPWLYHHLPFFGGFRAPARYLLATQFCLVVLSAFGLESWLRGFGRDCPQPDRPESPPVGAATVRAHSRCERGSFLATLLGAALLLTLLSVLFWLYIPGHATPGSRWQELIEWVYGQQESLIPQLTYDDAATLARTGDRAASQLVRAMVLTFLVALVVIWAKTGKARAALLAATVLLLLIDLGTFLRSFLATYDEAIVRHPTTVTKFLRDQPYPPRLLDASWIPNKAILYEVSSVGGYAGNALLRYNSFMDAVLGPGAGVNPTLGQLEAMADEYQRLLAIEYRIPVAGGPLTECQGTYPRAFLAEAPLSFDSSTEALNYVRTPGADFRRRPAVENLETRFDPSRIDESESVRFVSFRRNRVVLEVESRRPRLFVLNEMYSQDWSARVNGEAAAVYPANYVFRAVCVPGGRSTVVFAYRPPSFRMGLLVSFASLFLVAATLALSLFRKAAAASREGEHSLVDNRFLKR